MDLILWVVAYMMEWDNGGRIIVKGSTIRGNTCYGGSVIIPFNKNRNDINGNFAEYVVDANADDNWIIVKSNNHSTHQKRYYIIEKNEEIEQLHQEDIIAKYIVSFSDSIEFANECFKKGIGISW